MAPKIRGNSLYKITNGGSWETAQENAQSMGGNLTIIGSSEENNWITAAFLYAANTTSYFPIGTAWIGLTDSKVEGAWIDPAGRSPEFTNWITTTSNSEPNGGRNENYAEITLGGSASNWGWQVGGWNDAPSNQDRNAGIAEIPLTSSIAFSTTTKEGGGIFTTSINLSAGTQSTGNLAEGATVYWKVTGITADDLASGQLSGSGTITNGKLDLQHSLKADVDTGEQFEVSVFSDAAMSQQIGTLKSQNILEGSSPQGNIPKLVVRGNSLYTVVDGPSWTQAQANAVKLGGHLATINTADENTFLTSTYASSGFTQKDIDNWTPGDSKNIQLWIGFTDSQQEGRWSWVSGEAPSYSNWRPGEPDENATAVIPGGEDYASFLLYENGFASPGQWADISNVTVGGGIAEIPFIQRGDSAYVIVQGPTWEEAEADAQALGGHLVTINDAEENQWLHDTFKINPWWDKSSDNEYFGGLHKDAVLNTWRWSSGAPVAYTRWSNGEPSGGDGENYLGLGWSDPYSWNDTYRNPGHPYQGIAEIRLSDLEGYAFTTDATPPTLQSTTASNNQLILTFSEDIQITGGGTLNPAYLSVTVDGQARKVIASEVSSSSTQRNQLVLTLSGNSLLSTKSHAISYTPPTDTNAAGAIKGVNGGNAASFAINRIDNYSSSRSIAATGISSAYTNLILSGSEPNAGYGNALNNRLTGNDGNNILDGLAGSDTLIGSKGDDTYIIDNAEDVITELAGEGTDTVRSSISYELGATLENLTLIGNTSINGTGNSSSNTITGNSTANILKGNGGKDTLVGGTGNDTYIVDSADDTVTEAASATEIDTVMSSVSWILGFSLENLTLTGTSAINGTGNERNNTISGNDAANVIDGGNGGTDRLTGLEGSDVYQFSTRPSSFTSASADHITDFSSSQGDKIQITKSAFGITASTASLSVVTSTAALYTALSSASLFIYNTSNGELHWNQNGTLRGAGSGGVLGILDNKSSLSSGDLMLV